MLRLSLITCRTNVLIYRTGIIRSFSTTSPLLRINRPRSSKQKTISHRIKTPEELLEQASSVDIDNLKKDVEFRTDIRYTEPNKKWLSTFSNVEIPSYFDFKDTKDARKFMRRILIEKFGDVNREFTWKEFQFSELEVGDVVDLSNNFEKSDLSVIAQLPTQPEDPRYTLINQYGEIQFVSKAKMGLRLPNIFPKEWFKNVVMPEMEFLKLAEEYNVSPVGKPKYKLEEVIDRNKMFESASARTMKHENAAPTFIIPSILAGIISEQLTSFITKSWEKLPSINLKLEVLHNVLQSNESPIQLSIYQLYQAVLLTDLNEVARNLKNKSHFDTMNAYKKLLKTISVELSLNNQYTTISLGKSLYGSLPLFSTVKINEFYGFILSLRKNNKLYAHDSFNRCPSSCIILPITRLVRFNKIVTEYKSNPVLYENLTNFICLKLENKPTDKLPLHYNEFIELLKLFCAGSIHNNVLESFVLKIVRMLPQYANVDITNSCVYEILLNIGAIENTEGPIKWWDNAMMPESGISKKSDYEQSYYDSITSESLSDYMNLESDIHTLPREKFDDVIYCIDSVNPLEIDDGIAIKQLNNDEFIVSTYVADPSSYLSPTDTVTKIAFDRGMSLYLPDLTGTSAIPLLPVAFGQETQLGYNGKDTRVFRISFKYNIKLKKYFELDDSQVIKFGMAKKFVKIDYASTNKILANDPQGEKILNDISKATGIEINKIKNDLTKLSVISQCLNESASKKGRVSLYDQINISKDIEKFSQDENNNITMTFKDIYNDDKITRSIESGTRSEQLVSEIMVMSNHLSGKFFQKHNIPAVFKIQNKLAKSPEVENFCDDILAKDKASFKEITILQEYLTKSGFAPYCDRHEFLDMDQYSPVTSPLRRFCDIINHWQLHHFICHGEYMFNQDQINYLTLQLIHKDQLTNKISKKVIAFYTFKALMQLQNKSDKKFKVIITKKPSESGLVEVLMLDYGVRCILETSWYALSGNKNDEKKRIGTALEIGDFVDDTRIKDIDLLDGAIVLVSESV